MEGGLKTSAEVEVFVMHLRLRRRGGGTVPFCDGFRCVRRGEMGI